MPSVLFVCTANRFRSPLAAAIFEHILRETGDPNHWVIGTAGTWTTPGMPPLAEAFHVARRLGVCIPEGHLSRTIEADDLRRYDAVVVMERGQKEALRVEFPFAEDRIYLFAEALGQPAFDIPDPLDLGNDAPGIGNDIYEMLQSGYEALIVLAESKIKPSE